MEPMLLEDYKYGEVPKTITNLLDFYQRNNLSPDKNDIIVSFLYILMMELGFVDKDCTDIVEDCDFNYRRLLRYSRTLPNGWKKQNSYQLDFILKSAPHIDCSIVCVAVSDDLLINCTVKDISRYSLLLDPLLYFISSKVQLQKLIFQNLDHLALNFKNSIAFPAKVTITQASGGICACLQFLPHELLSKIISYLNIPDVLSLAETCTDLWKTTQDVSVWVKLLDYDFKKKNVHKTYDDLKFYFQLKYAKEFQKIMLRQTSN